MELVETAGKLSYPAKIKRELFSYAYQGFETWHNKVFFYLCMEDTNLWEPVFGIEYDDNKHFEDEMKKNYLSKIENLQKHK